jgi:hypothetical protein
MPTRPPWLRRDGDRVSRRIDLELQPRMDGQPHVGVSGVGGIVGQEVDDAERAEEPHLSVVNRGPCGGGESGSHIDSCFFGPFSAHQFCNQASRESRGRVLVSGCRARRWGSGALRARCATCSRSSARRWAMQPGRDGSRPTRTDRSTAPSLSEARRRRCRHGPRRARPVPQLGHAQDPHLAIGGCSRPPGPLHGHCSRPDPRREASRGYHEGLGGLVS